MKNLETELRNILKSRNLDLRENFTRNIIDIIEPPLPHVVAAAVSSGKTYLTAAKFELYYKCGLIKKDEKVLILASSLTILRDNFIEQFEQFKIDSFTYKSIENKSDLQQAIKDNIQVLITIPQTIDKHLKLIKNVKWMVVDEAHKWYFASTIRRIKQQLKPKYTLLLTGTPFKFNARKSEFIIDYTSVKDLYDKGYIDDVQLKVLHSSVELAQMDYASILGHLKQSKRLDTNELTKSLDIVIKQLIKILKLKNKRWDSVNNISKNYISLFTKMEKSIIFTNGITECDCIYECLKLNKVNCLKSHSEDDQDAVYTFQQFKKDDSIKVLVVVNRGKEGFNFPELYNIIDFSYTQDFATSMQMIGRLLRKSQGKIDKVFYKVAPKNTSLYFMDWMNYLIQLFDNEWYEKYNGRNARQIRVPSNLLNGGVTTDRTQRDRRRTTFNPTNLNETGMLSLSFMNKNKWFKADDILSVIGSTSLEDIFKKYGFYKRIVYLSLEDCLKYVHQLKLKSNIEWDNYCASGKKPDNIPANYRKVFGISTGVWLGTGRISDWDKKFKPVNELQKLCKELNIKSKNEWFDYWKNNKRPDDIPADPIKVYKLKGWGILLKKEVRTKITETWDFKPARKFVRNLKLKGNKGWREYSKNGKRPIQIPGNPCKYYSKLNVWTSWKDFLGDDTMRTPNKK